MSNLKEQLHRLLPIAVAWAETHAAEIAQHGISLPLERQEIARRVGVRYPERIRIRFVKSIPSPTDPYLQAAAEQVGLLGPGGLGMTLGYSLYIVTGQDTDSLIAHECRHVQQFEHYGSLASFLTAYLLQVVEYGYEGAPLEQEARQYERHFSRINRYKPADADLSY